MSPGAESPPPAGRTVVIGAGLAGLRCASLLARKGIEVEVIEASSGVGGRARTDEIEGFHLDRGFQVLLTSYPEARDAFDLEALDLGRFRPGALIHRPQGGFDEIVDPLRSPGSILSAATSPALTIADKIRVALMRFRTAGADPHKLAEKADGRSARELLESRGFSESAIEDFFRPFFGGVLIDPELDTDGALMDLYFGYFSTGDAALPAGGMGALSRQLASSLPEHAICLGNGARKLGREGVVLEDGRTIEADAIVLAAGERTNCDLLGLPRPAADRITACVYFDAPDREPVGNTLLLAPAGENGPINEVAFPSAVANGYAPPGRALVSVSAVGEEAVRGDLVEAATEQLGRWFGEAEVSEWRHLETCLVEDALPAFGPGRFAPGTSRSEAGDGLFVCGDYLESPSIQGALLSGRKAAEAVTAHLQKAGVAT